MQGNKIVLGYWAIRGRGQTLRLLLAYSGLDWEDKQYKGPQTWFGNGDKAKIGFDFPNLPYLINGDYKMTQSSAIATYISRIAGKNLLGKTPQDEGTVNMVTSLITDIFTPTYSLFFSPNHEQESKRLFDSKIKEKLTQLNKFIGDKQYILGYITLADFVLAEAFYYFEKLYGSQINEFKGISKVHKNIENLPEIKAYYKKENAVKGPFLPGYAKLQF